MTGWQLLAPLWYRELVVLGPACSDHGCRELARFTCYWPGQTVLKCAAHREAWSTVAGHMGFELAVVDLPLWVPTGVDGAVVRFSLMELDR